MKEFGLLQPYEIECRVSTVVEKGVAILLYKTARTDADILDKVCGPMNWQNDFKLVDGVLYGGIGIYDEKFDRWVWKWDAGVESNTEAEKGRASDAFKRSGFKFGIGRELYSAPFIFVSKEKCKIETSKKTGKLVCRDRFVVSEIGYDEFEHINKLVICREGIPVYTLAFSPKNLEEPKKTENKNPEPEQPTQVKMNSDGSFTPTCAGCGCEISVKVHDFSVEKYKKPLCMKCQKKQNNEN